MVDESDGLFPPLLPDGLAAYVTAAGPCWLTGERRLETLPIGTRVLLTLGRVGVLERCSFVRALVRIEGERTREFEARDAAGELRHVVVRLRQEFEAISPASELETLEPSRRASVRRARVPAIRVESPGEPRDGPDGGKGLGSWSDKG